MLEHLFYDYPVAVTLSVIALILWIATLTGYLIGRVMSRRVTDSSQTSAVQASVLGMLGLMLGFTFGVAFTRFDARRVLVIDEANAMGTTYMRAQMLPEPYRTRISRDLRAYIDLHMLRDNTLKSPRELEKSLNEAKKLQYSMWREATAVAAIRDTEITSLFVDSLNQSIELYSSRIAHAYARVPSLILWLLLCISVVSVALVGYGFGVSGERGWGMMILVAGVLAAILVMIADLDDPGGGLITTSQQSILDLRDDLSGFETPDQR